MDILSFKNRKRESASRRVRRLLNRYCAESSGGDERRGDTRVLYPQPACIIPLKQQKVPLLDQRATVFLCDLSSTGISFFTAEAPTESSLLLCLRDDGDKQFGDKPTLVYIKVRVCQSVDGEQGFTRTGCEILEEVLPTGRYAMLPVAFASHSIPRGGIPSANVPEAVQRMCAQPDVEAQRDPCATC